MKKLVIFLVLASCSNPPSAKEAKTDFCNARAAYKLLAAASDGKLDPAPGSPRAKLEEIEDAFCATVSP